MTLDEIERRHDLDIEQLKSDAARTREFVERYEPLLAGMILTQARRVKLADAIIEKSLAGAVWALAAFIGYVSWEFVKAKLGISKGLP